MKKIGIIFLCLNLLNTAQAATPFSDTELKTIKHYMLDNIASEEHVFDKQDGDYKIHSLPGAVLASPSNRGTKFSQDYQFHWIRDAALIMNEVAFLYASPVLSDEKKELKKILINYINFEHIIQKQTSNAGDETLGQPKYNINATVWEGPWGRPQNDGPALRALTMINIANIFIKEHEDKWVKENLMSLITTDLDYVIKMWRRPTYDLWEEVYDADHFFTKMVQRKSLIEGAKLLKELGDHQRHHAYLTTAQSMSTSINKHWNENLGYFSETINQQENKGGGLDTSVIIGVLHGNLQKGDDVFAVNNERVMSTVYHLRNTFANLYKINSDYRTHAPLIGRYAGDVYDGDQFVYGNPWILTTNAIAQYYYALARAYQDEGKIVITALNLPFFKQINLHVVEKEGVISYDEKRDLFNMVILTLISEGDRFLKIVKRYSVCYSDKSCLHFAEQIDRNSGEQVSAKDLTWGYASVLTAMQAREAVD